MVDPLPTLVLVFPCLSASGYTFRIMDPGFGKACFNVVTFVGIGLTLIGGIGTWYFGDRHRSTRWRTPSIVIGLIGIALSLVGAIETSSFDKRLEAIAPYRERIVSVNASVWAVIGVDTELDGDFDFTHATIAFVKNDEKLLDLYSIQCTARRFGVHTLIYEAEFEGLGGRAFGKPVCSLRETEYVEYYFHEVPLGAKVLDGGAIYAFNSRVAIVIPIQAQEVTVSSIGLPHPSQAMKTGGRLRSWNLQDSFKEFPE